MNEKEEINKKYKKIIFFWIIIIIFFIIISLFLIFWSYSLLSNPQKTASFNPLKPLSSWDKNKKSKVNLNEGKIDEELLEMAGFKRIIAGNEILHLGSLKGKFLTKRDRERCIAVIDRVFVSEENRGRIIRNLEAAKRASANEVITVISEDLKELRFSLKNICAFNTEIAVIWT